MQQKIRSFVIVLGVFMFVPGCFFQPTPVRLDQSKVNSTFDHGLDLPFAQYLQRTRQMVEKTRQDLNGPDREKIVAANTPFELVPDPVLFPKEPDGKYARGVLLIHGLSDSPYHMQPIGEHLRNSGFLVRAILLPGHGTVPGDLTRVTFEAWVKAVDYGVERMKPLVDQIFIAGFSTGGSLAVYHTLVHQDVHGLLLFSPALKVKSSMAWMAPWLIYFRPWIDIEQDEDFAKYESFATNGAAQIYRLTRAIDRQVKRGDAGCRIPVFAALSYDDNTVDAGAFIDFFNTTMTHPQSRVILYSGHPLAGFAANPRVTQVNSHLNSEDGTLIVDFAHTSIPLPPEDTHYGQNGTYKNCLHYKPGSTQRDRCLGAESRVKGETSDDNLKKYDILQRLTYNPLYEEMLIQMDRFLDQE
ncbi:alpha/beta hydrolase [Desulforapulum autotrophicum]|nr:alpha/beta fold hydrolase [Desulforapulum autotrophicum]